MKQRSGKQIVFSCNWIRLDWSTTMTLTTSEGWAEWYLEKKMSSMDPVQEEPIKTHRLDKVYVIMIFSDWIQYTCLNYWYRSLQEYSSGSSRSKNYYLLWVLLRSTSLILDKRCNKRFGFLTHLNTKNPFQFWWISTEDFSDANPHLHMNTLTVTNSPAGTVLVLSPFLDSSPM